MIAEGEEWLVRLERLYPCASISALCLKVSLAPLPSRAPFLAPKVSQSLVWRCIEARSPGVRRLRCKESLTCRSAR